MDKPFNDAPYGGSACPGADFAGERSPVEQCPHLLSSHVCSQSGDHLDASPPSVFLGRSDEMNQPEAPDVSQRPRLGIAGREAKPATTRVRRRRELF